MKKVLTRRQFLKKSSQYFTAVSLGGCNLLLKGCRSKKDFELIIKGGYIFDGSGNAAFEADIGISGNVIKKIGEISASRAKSVLGVNGLVVCPGFIDVHDHTDIELLVNPKAESSIRQGITTLVSGNCGSSPFPIAEEEYEEMKENLRELYQLDLDWVDITGFFSRLEEKGIALNYSTLVGHGAIRGAAMGFNDRPAKHEELEKMMRLVVENIKNGAVGLSTGLEYAPGSYAQADEITALCQVVARYGGVYATHMRDEGDFLLESLEEAIDVARKTGVSLEISHFKIAYPRNWPKIDEALGKIKEASEEGISIFCDRYPYIAGSTGLSFFFPLWAKQGTTEGFLARLKDPTMEGKIRAHLAEQEKKLGSWDKVFISSVISEENKQFEGHSVLEGAKTMGQECYDFMRGLLLEEKNRVGVVIFNMKEENLKKILAHPLVGVGTDGSAKAPYGPLGRGKPHPRSYGTFPRIFGKYVRQEKLVSLPEMIKKVTSIPAKKFGLEKRGLLQEEYYADIVIFDQEKVMDKATWTQPHQYPEGIEYVVVNGQKVIDRGEHTGASPGKILRKQLKI